MKQIEHVLTVRDLGDSFGVEWVVDNYAPLESIKNILYSVLETAITAAKDEGASDEEVLKTIGFASFQAVKDAGIIGEFDAFVASKTGQEESGEAK